MGTYLDCGCYIDESGHRAFCPSCDAEYLFRGKVETEAMSLYDKIKDIEADLADQRQVNLWLESKIAAFAIPHMALDDENTPAEKYDDLMRDWTVAAHGLVDAYLSLKISDQ